MQTLTVIIFVVLPVCIFLVGASVAGAGIVSRLKDKTFVNMDVI